MQMNTEEIAAAKKLIELAIAEDIGSGDLTSEYLINKDVGAKGCFIAKCDMVVCGLEIVRVITENYCKNLVFLPLVEDGDFVKTGSVIANITGKAAPMLSFERIMLNFMQRMSGVATLSKRYVDEIAGTKANLLDTRKTTPGWRLLEKYAVRAGGGHNHRIGLYDAVMIKDNHIAISGSISAAVAKVTAKNIPVIVECDNLEQVAEAVELPISRILLDNMDTENLKKSVTIVNGRLPLEASGGVNLQNILSIAKTGVDYISVGAITHSSTSADISLDVEINPN